ncbi:UDP-4-amino-4,6-dideoxy-N-acetyl-beta-L-altrosamine transaminase [Pseudobutyrivibrio sp. YE44]|uniref:UDP-4-amino-4, 6-dideoxy-N-acetyl-beta-L-altrosamine transaminase n=1 Tax=Pseudobutyrivibrio sp. YE44 TaxID=1520802 RepID=UPI000882DAA0|nr:UDP-4-amino-4,6-dideoxy-N-acetyl-beta-L-altrosamine transaminase [Pseudobutyrivibrio sp. YE44]SDB54118.1 UDP-4-amino-4,6-dideoxy-N-acetyl-beta-L-altrosamine transaminase [Pseudobutyrivibrio sp. YE44]
MRKGAELEKLAINGGYPVRNEKIFYGCQCIDEEDTKAVVETLLSPYITCGPKVEETERKLEEYTGAKHAVVVSNGTAALHCACIAAGVGPGDEVITTPLTFAASANCALYCGAKPVFADIDPETYNIDPKSIEEHITEKTKAVVAVDFTGQAVKIKEIREICDKHNLIFIEDGAHSIGTKYDGKYVGSLADITCFSFHPVKTITAGEGGAVTTNRDDLYQKIVEAHTHGIVHEEELMEEAPHEGPWYYEQISLGYNYRMTDFQAALLLSQMKKLEKFKARRHEIVEKYNKAFAEVPEIIVQKEIPESDTCRHLYIIRLDLDRLTCTRREFFDAMSAENVQPQIHYVPVYWFPYYKHLGYERGLCPNAEEVYKGIMSIPLYPKMTDEDVDDVIAAVKKVVEAYRK